MVEEEIIVIEDETEEEIVVLEEDLEYIEPTTQEKTIIPTKEEQVVIPDDNIFALSKVTIEKIPDEYIIPNGDIQINSNGIYDVTEQSNAIVNVPEKQLGTKTITSNGTYNAIDDNLDGYSSVEVETSGVDITEYFETTITSSNSNRFASKSFIKKVPKITIESNVTDLSYAFSNTTFTELELEGDTSNVTNMMNMFYGAKIKQAPMLDTSNVKNMSSMYYGSSFGSGFSIPAYNTSKVTDFGYFCQYNTPLVSIEQLDFSSATNIGTGAFQNTSNLVNVGGFKDVGKAYLTTKSANYSNYTLSFNLSSKLTHDSLMNIINNLYDIASKGCNTQKLQIGSTNLAKLTEEEIAIATNKGWSIV